MASVGAFDFEQNFAHARTIEPQRSGFARFFRNDDALNVSPTDRKHVLLTIRAPNVLRPQPYRRIVSSKLTRSSL